MTTLGHAIDFSLPDSSIAIEPAEKRGVPRDGVRLMVTRRSTGSIEHDTFANLDRHLAPGDVVVVNTSATLPAALDAHTADGTDLKVHVATPASGGLWSVEVRMPTQDGGTAPGPEMEPQTLYLPGQAQVHLLARSPRTPRLWIAAIEGPTDVNSFLELHGEPIRYMPGAKSPISDYQTIFAMWPGSAEMPSAARPFTPELVTRLVSRGVAIAPIVLHAGVSSYEEGETPGEERYDVPATTATIINTTRARDGRTIAVGTTVVRALETVADETGTVHPGRGLTDLIITADRGVNAVDGLVTGWHEPRSSHLSMLEALIPTDHLQHVYDRAITDGYLWHEFGDSLLILPG